MKRDDKIIPVPVHSPMMVKQQHIKLLLFCIIDHPLMYQKDNKHQFLPQFLIKKSVSSIRYMLTCTYSENSNQPAYPHSLIKVSVFRWMKGWALGYLKSANLRLWSDCADVQSDLIL